MAPSSPAPEGNEFATSGLTFDLSVAKRRPPPVVFALLADVQDAEPIPRSAAVRMVKVPTGPTRIGTRRHEWVRVDPGYWFHVESVVSHVQEPYQLSMDFHSRWLTGHLAYNIEPAPDGSILHHRETVRPRVVLRWLTPFIERRLRPRIIERLADLKDILESSQ